MYSVKTEQEKRNSMPSIAAGITLYEPDLTRLEENIESVLAQTDCVYLVDNASGNTAAIKKRYRTSPKIRILENSDNAGVAHALNQMCEAAIADGFDWILTLDQDSLAETDLIEKYRAFLDDADIGLLTPRFIDDNEPRTVSSITLPPYETVHRCNTSASLVRLEAYRQVGGFDEALFIDCVDFDYCTLLEETGFRILRVNDAVLHHRLGSAREVDFFLPLGRLFHIKKLQKPMFTYNHSPLRTYYYARNIKYYMYKHKNTIDLRTERRVYFKWLVLKLFFEDQKWQKLKAILRGRRDAEKMISALKSAQRNET